MARAVAVNVAANTNDPGFRGPVYPDGTFAYVPIPEREPTRPPSAFPVADPVPTYADCELPFELPTKLRDVPVHQDPEFPGVHGRSAPTYGDHAPIKAGPIGDLERGDWLLFYATLTLRPADWRGPGTEVVGDDGADERGGDWLRETSETGETGAAVNDDLAPDWGAYLFAAMRVETVVNDPSEATAADLVPTNAHLKRGPVDARVVVRGDPNASGLFERVLPLSTPDAGADANRLVTDLSADSGKGPWWRRPLRYDDGATDELLERVPGLR
ncbi:hypothetical protein JCM17823_20740 [Halorubrum gandharaense]